MFKVNDNFLNLSESYLFSTVAREVEDYKKAHPESDIIKMGIGDVTLPLPPAIIAAMHHAVDDMANAATFKGYGPEQGHGFLRDAIAQNDYIRHDIDINADDIFINDGAKSDLANILDILGLDNRIALTDPVYPVYLDSNIMAGRKPGVNIVMLPCTSDNKFIPPIPTTDVDIIYLCYPNNPTGTTLTRQQLTEFVDYALAHNSLILFDSAYEAFITSPDIPHSIYEIEGAKRCAIEFRSFSKTAGFTGVRCGYTVVPRDLISETANGDRVELRKLWNRRQTTKFNGASYISQRAAEAIYTANGHDEIMKNVGYYLNNAHLLREALSKIGLEVYGGIDSPYIWLKSPNGEDSWQFFRFLLDKCNIVTTPGVGFGPSGEGYVRLTAFNTLENTLQAVERIKKLTNYHL